VGGSEATSVPYMTTWLRPERPHIAARFRPRGWERWRSGPNF